tara:strand:- start:50 stop:394 length:345 start_codon:yes stop_codon:yes gene_type:complete
MNLLILKKNGKSAKIVKDTGANFLDLDKLIDVLKAKNAKDTFEIVCVDAEVAKSKVIKSNFELGLNGDGSARISKETADVIARALARCKDSTIDFEDDSEFKTRARIDKINKMC